jgi:hypothetical protein
MNNIKIEFNSYFIEIYIRLDAYIVNFDLYIYRRENNLVVKKYLFSIRFPLTLLLFCPFGWGFHARNRDGGSRRWPCKVKHSIRIQILLRRTIVNCLSTTLFNFRFTYVLVSWVLQHFNNAKECHER